MIETCLPGFFLGIVAWLSTDTWMRIYQGQDNCHRLIEDMRAGLWSSGFIEDVSFVGSSQSTLYGRCQSPFSMGAENCKSHRNKTLNLSTRCDRSEPEPPKRHQNSSKPRLSQEIRSHVILYTLHFIL